MRVIVLTLPIGYVLAVPFGLATTGVWIGIAVSNVIAGIIAPLWFQTSRKAIGA